MSLISLIFQKAYAQTGIGVGIPGTSCATTIQRDATTGDPVLDAAGHQIPIHYDLATYIGCIYQFATYIAIGLAILMIIWGGYKYITSQGNPDVLTEAKEIIWGTIIGLLVLGLGWLIISSIGGNIVS